MQKVRQRGAPRCSFCTEPSVIRLFTPDRHLCAAHFLQDLARRVEGTVAAHSMISRGDRIAVALSGGKDSTALLLILHDILTPRDGVTLVAVTADEGIAGYRDATIRAAEHLVQELSLEHRQVSFASLFGKDLDEILRGREERACSVCGILRRKALLAAAADAGATKLATGHNLDDEAQSVLMNALRGDPARFVRDSGIPSADCFLPRIKPLREISEKEIAVFLFVRDRFPDLPECPYTRYALRAEIRSWLSHMESRHPGTMLRLVRGREQLSAALAGIPPAGGIGRCRSCGEPCSGKVCQTCRLIEEILD